MKKLIIVESPTKAKTISKFLGKGYKVTSSMGHIRDLPKSKIGVDVEKDFTPTYEIPTKAKKTVAELKKLAKDCETIYFASDEDREGEAIAWHLNYILKPKPEQAKRIVFHEITKEAILKALETPRDIDQNLVDAQQARRVLDRLVGYELSPFLWKKVARGLSAGRVQSVAVRLVVEKEAEIEAFKPDEYWTVDGIFAKNEDSFPALLQKMDGKSIGKFGIKEEKAAQKILAEAQDNKYSVKAIKTKETEKKPLAPFTTSTLQQESSHKLGYSSKKTMMLAQQLYEGINIGEAGSVGLITYMRTDSVNLANKFLNDAKDYITNELGKEYYPGTSTAYKKKQKNAQEAHEAIRPTEAIHSPESIKESLNSAQFKVYNLIWSRAVASQMSHAKVNQTGIELESADKKYLFKANGSVIAFDGYLKVYQNATKEEILPELKAEDDVETTEIKANQHFTQPPARFSEASLIKKMEELGIGRPSTYAPTLSTIQDRNYVTKEEKRFQPTEVGTLVSKLLVEHFPQITNYEFTANMEDKFDDVAAGKTAWIPVISEFYHPFHKNLEKKDKELSKKELTEEATDEKCDKCGSAMVIKMGRFGKFMACSNYPDCKSTKPIGKEAEEMAKPENKIDKKCPECKSPLVIKFGRFGKFMGCSNYPDCKYILNIEKKTGTSCPECEKGEIIVKKSRAGRTFYACNKYPDCKFALWQAPTGEKCPDCKSLLVYKNKQEIACSSKECKFTKENDQDN